MKRILLILSILLSSSLYAQSGVESIFGPSRKQLQAQNDSLRIQIDSLQDVIDSLYLWWTNEMLANEEVIEEIEETQDSLVRVEYTTEVSDSLLHLWYKNSLNGELTAVNEYDMDSVSFVSNITKEDMIKRVEDMNSFISLPFNDNVRNYIIMYSEKMPERMKRVMGLAEYYFPIFEETFSRYGMPLELKYMAVIESMLNPVAKSRAGAMGMWQFMFSTARNYNLQINSYIDERLDVEKAVDAAARYLKDAYQVFGDWALAISSYNCGAGNVSKAIRRAGGSRDFWSIYPYLPRETRGYVPAFVGAMYAFHYAKDYGLSPADVGLRVQTDTIEIRRNLHFKQINKVVGIPEVDLHNLNPQYLHSIIPGAVKPCILRIPYNWTAAFLDANKDSLYAYKADSLFTEKIVKDVAQNAKGSNDRIAYKVKSGDYLGKIAAKYNVSVKKLQTWNNLKGTSIRVGQTLYIYRGGVAPSSSTKSSLSTVSNSTTSSNKTSSSSSSSKSNSSSGSRTYIVKSGDSLYTIAKNYPGVSADNIKAANNLKSNTLRPGQKLIIPAP